MKRFKILALMVALLAMVSMVSAPAAAQGATVTIPKGSKIKIGWAGDLSLQLIKPSQGVQFGAQIALNRKNAAGGIKGFEVELVTGDDNCKGDTATTVAQKFVSDPQIVGIVGHVCSGATIPASDVYEKARIVMVSASSTANKVTDRGLTVINRVVFNDDNQAIGVALYLFNEAKAKKIAVLDDNQDYGKGLADALVREFKKLGGTVTLNESIDKDAKDYKPVLTKLLADAPDVVFFGGYYGPAALLVQQMREIGLDKAAFFGPDGVYGGVYPGLAGKAGEGTYASSLAAAVTDKTALDAFQAEWDKTFTGSKFSEYDPYQPNGYDAAGVLLAAIESVATTNAAGDLVIDREALIKAVRATKDFKGLTGSLSCDAKGECGAGAVLVSILKGDKWEPVKNYSAADLSAVAAPAMSATMAPTMAATAAK
jgi:branched-chain amino acid transport system substrate-binding protein